MHRKVMRRLIGAAAAVALAGASIPAQAQDFINVLTGGTSGVYYPMGVALSKIFTDKVQGSRPSVQATKASVENLTLLQQGKGEIGFTLGDSLAMGWAGDEEAGFRSSSTSCAASPPSTRTTSRSWPRRNPATRRSPI
jgi:TRAP transporter TAXI family solute receptor